MVYTETKTKGFRDARVWSQGESRADLSNEIVRCQKSYTMNQIAVDAIEAKLEELEV